MPNTLHVKHWDLKPLTVGARHATHCGVLGGFLHSEQVAALFAPFLWKQSTYAVTLDIPHVGVLSQAMQQYVYGVMLLTPQHTFQHIIQRPADLAQFKAQNTPEACVQSLLSTDLRVLEDLKIREQAKLNGIPSRWEEAMSIHEYIHIVDQLSALLRIPGFLQVPAAVRGIRCVPMLGPVRFDAVTGHSGFPANPLEPVYRDDVGWVRPIQHVEIGGDKGKGSRPCDLDWFRSMIQQCRSAATPCNVLRLGPNAYDSAEGAMNASDRHTPLHDPNGANPVEWPEYLRVQMKVGESWPEPSSPPEPDRTPGMYLPEDSREKVCIGRFLVSYQSNTSVWIEDSETGEAGEFQNADLEPVLLQFFNSRF